MCPRCEGTRIFVSSPAMPVVNDESYAIITTYFCEICLAPFTIMAKVEQREAGVPEEVDLSQQTRKKNVKE